MWLCLRGRTRISSQVLCPVTYPERPLGFAPASLPSPFTAGFCGKEHTHTFHNRKCPLFLLPTTLFFFCTRRNYLVPKWPEQIFKSSVITNCSQLCAAEGYQKSFSWNNSLTNLRWILLKKYYLHLQMPKTKYYNVPKSLWLKSHFPAFHDCVISFVTTITENSHLTWSTAWRQKSLIVFWILWLTNEKRL